MHNLVKFRIFDLHSFINTNRVKEMFYCSVGDCRLQTVEQFTCVLFQDMALDRQVIPDVFLSLKSPHKSEAQMWKIYKTWKAGDGEGEEEGTGDHN